MTRLFVKSPLFLSNFWHLICYNFCDILRKKCEIILFKSLKEVSEDMPKIVSIGQPIAEKRLFKKLKLLLFLASFISETKIVDIFNFPIFQFLTNVYHFWIFDIYRLTIVELTSRRTCYFGSLDTDDNNFITEKEKQQ